MLVKLNLITLNAVNRVKVSRQQARQLVLASQFIRLGFWSGCDWMTVDVSKRHALGIVRGLRQFDLITGYGGCQINL